MEWMAVPKPIFDTQKDIMGYQLAYQLGNALIERGREKVYSFEINIPFFQFVNDTGLETLTYNKLFFLPISNVTLALEIEKIYTEDFSLTVLMLDKNVAFSEMNLSYIKKYRQLGFKVSTSNFSNLMNSKEAAEHIDYLFHDINGGDFKFIANQVRRASKTTKIIATNVNTQTDFYKACEAKADYLDGNFYKASTSFKYNAISPLQVNYFQILNDVNKEDFEVEKFAKVIQRDTWLTLNFLKMVNSSRTWNTPIKSLRYAAALIGHKEIKQWIITAVASALSQDKPSELTRVSLMRAKFCENLAGLFEQGVHKENLFLIGLLSVLDIILEMPFAQALTLVAVPAIVKDTLLGKDNDCRKVLDFVMLYEFADWTELSRVAIMRNISITNIFKAYNEVLLWYGKLINMKIDEIED